MAGFPPSFGDTLGDRLAGRHRPPLRAVGGGRRDLLLVSEVAARLALSDATVYRMIERGALPAVIIGRSLRVSPADLEAFIERSRNGDL